MKIIAVLVLIGGFLAEGEPTVGRYVTFLMKSFSAPQDLKYSTAIIFDRSQGEVNREVYKRAYGSHGRLLVEAYGNGLSKKQLEDLGYFFDERSLTYSPGIVFTVSVGDFAVIVITRCTAIQGPDKFSTVLFAGKWYQLLEALSCEYLQEFNDLLK